MPTSTARPPVRCQQHVDCLGYGTKLPYCRAPTWGFLTQHERQRTPRTPRPRSHDENKGEGCLPHTSQCFTFLLTLPGPVGRGVGGAIPERTSFSLMAIYDQGQHSNKIYHDMRNQLIRLAAAKSQTKPKERHPKGQLHPSNFDNFDKPLNSVVL